MAWNEPDDDQSKQQDPWRAKRSKQDGPPDLDEAFRRFRRRVNGMFGGKRSEDGGGFAILGLIFIIAIGVWAAAGIFIVRPAEQGVILRFGKYYKTVDPGPHWIPHFVDTKYIVNVQKVSNFKTQAEMLTKDENIVSVSLAVQYRIGDPNAYLFNVVHPEASLRQATASALRAVIGSSNLNAVLTTGRAEIRDKISTQIKTILSRYNTGLIVTDIAMQPAKAPEEVKAAFDDAIKAQEDEQRFISKAEAYSNGVLPKAQGTAARITAEANAYKQQVVLEATGDASRFSLLLPEYRHAPAVMRERLYLDAIESMLTKTSKVLMDTKGSNNLVYLPLDRMLNMPDSTSTANPSIKLSDIDAMKAEHHPVSLQRPPTRIYGNVGYTRQGGAQ